MPANFFSSSPSASISPTASQADSSDMPGDVVTSSSSTRFSNIRNYLWVPLLLSVSKEFTSAKAEPTLFLPSEIRIGSARSSPRCPTPDYKLNFRSEIGILTHPCNGASGRLNNDTNASYIAASYVKFVESVGARIISIIFNEPLEIIHEKLNLVNGVLFTEGWAKNGLYFDIVGEIFKLVHSNSWRLMPSRAYEEAYQSFCLQKLLASPFGRAHEGEGEESLKQLMQ